jgi:hypothetical protein
MQQQGETHLDLPKLLALGENEVHVLVEREHLTDEIPAVVAEGEGIEKKKERVRGRARRGLSQMNTTTTNRVTLRR